MDEARKKVADIRLTYETLCIKISGFPEDENALIRRKGEKVEVKKNEKKGGIVSQQAITPETNTNFINSGTIDYNIRSKVLDRE